MRLILISLLLFSLPATATTLTIGLDVSTSAPLAVRKDHALDAARRAYEDILRLEMGDVVIVKYFGDRRADNLRHKTFRIDRRHRQKEVADEVARIIAGVPTSGIETQPFTNIIAFLDFGAFGCDQGGKVLLVTDGVESSELVNEKYLMAGKVTLPNIDEGHLAGCTVTMFGLGAGAKDSLPYTVVKRLRTAWEEFMAHAGATFEPVILQ